MLRRLLAQRSEGNSGRSKRGNRISIPPRSAVREKNVVRQEIFAGQRSANRGLPKIVARAMDQTRSAGRVWEAPCSWKVTAVSEARAMGILQIGGAHSADCAHRVFRAVPR